MSEYGFDLTDIDARDFRKITKKFKLKHKKGRRSGKLGYTYHDWKGKGITLRTEYNPITGRKTQGKLERGFAGYIGITGKSTKVSNLARAIKRKAKYIKGENPHQREFI